MHRATIHIMHKQYATKKKPGQIAVEALLPHYGGSIKKLSDDIGVDRSTVRRWLNGDVDTPPSQLKNMERLLKIKTF